MARRYKLNVPVRVVNALMKGALRMGLGVKGGRLLTTTGRKTGKPRTTAVTLVEMEGSRYLVAPYGAVGWVHNARAAGEVGLARGSRSEIAAITELDAGAAAPVLKRYLEQIPFVRPYFDVRVDAPVEDFAAVAARHPVFRLSAR